MVGILHEGTTTSFFSETWVLTSKVLLQHPSVQIVEKLLSKNLSIQEYKKIEIAIVDSNQSMYVVDAVIETMQHQWLFTGDERSLIRKQVVRPQKPSQCW